MKDLGCTFFWPHVDNPERDAILDKCQKQKHTLSERRKSHTSTIVTCEICGYKYEDYSGE